MIYGKPPTKRQTSKNSKNIALIDFINVLNIIPDGYVGHSVGELACAYMDGCFTAEETILAAYYRGLASNETELIPGYMAAIVAIDKMNIMRFYDDSKNKLEELTQKVVSAFLSQKSGRRHG
ncbi:unnamed protein product [Timema podura]|uniref:Malonyl-CoA:ACP transacylase (MAT) domain-containing protein n=1 Tax=Timema podura TaxID=61482 RepID=A0ABN7NRF3_TIMPD|nr:unnamed protein product [Timema podura]